MLTKNAFVESLENLPCPTSFRQAMASDGGEASALRTRQGISIDTRRGKWRASIARGYFIASDAECATEAMYARLCGGNANSKDLKLGSFNTDADAARARDRSDPPPPFPSRPRRARDASRGLACI